MSEQAFLGPFPGQQTKFFQRTEREVFYGGAGGGGKSVCGLGKFLQQLAVERKRFLAGEIKQSKAWGLYLRRTMPDLKQAIENSYQIFQDMDPDATYDQNNHLWTFPSCGDAHFEFGHLEHEKSKYKYKSREFSYIFLDELTEYTETMYEYMDTRLRVSDSVLDEMLQICSGSNPDGPGLLWVRRRFIENKEPEVIYRKRITLDDGRIKEYDSIFIPAKLSDNPVLMRSGNYEASLKTKRPEVREAILRGNWYINPGAFLAEIWDSSAHVVPNHDVPKGCPVTRSCDPGIGAPTSVTWWYWDRNGGGTGVHNIYLKNHDATMMAKRIKEVEIHYGWWDEENDVSKLYGPMDEDAFNRNLSGGPNYAKAMANEGVRWKRSRKDRFNGAAEIVRRLSTRKKDLNGAMVPLLRWMERCKAPIETIPVLQTDPNDPNDVDTKGEDHCIAPYTLIETKEGTMPIVQMVGTSGFVRGREGKWTTYRNARLTRRTSPTVFVLFSDGYRVQCTPDHRFRDINGEWVEAKDLAGRLCMAAGNGGSHRATTGTTTASNFIGECGKTSTAPSRRGATFTTATRTRRTTSPRILSAFHRAFTGFITTPIRLFEELRQSESPLPRRLRSLLTSVRHAFSAAPDFAYAGSMSGRGFVLGSAIAGGSTSIGRSPEFARSAESQWQSSQARDPRQPAVTNADGLFVVDVLPAPPSDVYCIEVPDGHEFALPNGAVISNCWDDTMYMCLERPLQKRDEEDDDDDIIDLDEYRNRGRGGGQSGGGAAPALGVPPGGW